MPKDPVQRAKVKLFMHTAATSYIPQYLSFLMRDGPLDEVLFGLQMLQEQLPIEGRGEWLLGDQLSIGDIAVAPFLPRMELAFGNDLGAYAPGEGTEAFNYLRNDPGMKRYRQYVDAINANEGFQKSFDIVSASLRSSPVVLCYVVDADWDGFVFCSLGARQEVLHGEAELSARG